VGNTGLLPSTTVILLVSQRIEEIEDLIAETSHYSAHWAWNRRFIAVISYPPVRLAPGAGRLSPPSLKRLDRACPKRRLR
jgi:hypothetical protein